MGYDGRVLRFAHAVDVLEGDRACRFADLAADCGHVVADLDG